MNVNLWDDCDKFYNFFLELLSDVNTALYHYCSKETVLKIMQKDKVQLRLTRADQFDDKMEGKAFEVYYDIALEQLYYEKKINDAQRCQLEKIKVTDQREIFISNGKKSKLSNEHVDPYIICFSTKENDPYMFENYVHTGKNKVKAGYCICSHSVILKGLFEKFLKENVRFDIDKVLYGSEVIEYIKKYIISALDKCSTIPDLREYTDEIFQKIQYIAKLSKFRFENEVRLIAYVPKNASYNGDIRKVMEGGKTYIYIDLEKSAICGISPDENNLKEDDETLLKTLIDRKYECIHENGS